MLAQRRQRGSRSTWTACTCSRCTAGCGASTIPASQQGAEPTHATPESRHTDARSHGPGSTAAVRRLRPESDQGDVPGQLRRGERTAPALRQHRQGRPRAVPARLPIVLVPVEGPDGRDGEGPSGRRARHARLQPVVAPRRARTVRDDASRRGPAAVRREDCRQGQEVHAGRARLGRQCLVGVRHPAPRDARAADHRERRAPDPLRARTAREPGAALCEQLLLCLQQLSRAWRATGGREHNGGNGDAPRAHRFC